MRALPLLLGVALAVALSGCSDAPTPASTTPTTSTATTTTPPATTTPPTTTTPAATTPTVTTPPSGSGPVATRSVAMKGTAYAPPDIIVGLGATVTWTNSDTPHHTVTLDDNSHDSGVIPPNSTHSYSFDTAGTYRYHCAIHSSMTGSVRVNATADVAPDVPPPPPAPVVRLNITDNAFSPSNQVVHVGTMVVWNNTGNNVHTVTSSLFDSGGLTHGKEFNYTFTKTTVVGVAYQCTIHSGMRGTIQVIE